MNPTTQARLSLAAVAATLLTALSLSPLVQGVGWFVAVFVVVAVTAGSGAAARQAFRPWPAVLAIQLVAVVLVLTALFVRDVAVWGVLPGPEALQGFADLVTDGTTVTREQGAPVDATPGLLFLITAGLAGVSLVVDLVAVSLRRPAAAGLPLLAVYCVPTAVLRGGLSWPYFVLGGIGYLVLVGADAGDRVRGWGRVLASDRDEAHALGGPLVGARRLGVVCLLAAVLVPAVVPGMGNRLVGGSGTGTGPGDGSTIPVVNPLLDLRKNLTTQSDTPVITYRTTLQRPEPLRIVSADRFDGETWSPTTGVSLPRSQRVQDGLPPAPGLTPAVPTQRESTEISIQRYAQNYLPLPYPAERVDVEGDWLWDRRTLDVVAATKGLTTQDLSYSVQHLTVTPTQAQLQAATAPPSDVLDTYGKLPDNLPTTIRDVARQQAGGGTAYDQAVRLQQWLRSDGGFVYSTDAPGNTQQDSGEDAVVAFLKERHGYCVQFASTMAVMARTLGIPARVAVGFLPGKQLSDGSWQISLRDAHAWPELYFGGVGWVRFEPTPATHAPNAPAWTVPTGTTPSTQPSATSSVKPSVATPKIRPDSVEPGSAGATQTPLLQRVVAAVPWRFVAVLALMLLVLALPLAASWLRRRRRWRRALTPVQRAEAAWDELHERLADLGVGWTTAWTPRAMRRRMVEDHHLIGGDRDALSRLVADLEQARYMPPGAPGRPAADLTADVTTVVDAVAAQVEPSARRRARWLPASGVAALTGAARSMDLAAGDAGRRAADLGAEVRSEVRRTVGSGRH